MSNTQNHLNVNELKLCYRPVWSLQHSGFSRGLGLAVVLLWKSLTLLGGGDAGRARYTLKCDKTPLMCRVCRVSQRQRLKSINY